MRRAKAPLALPQIPQASAFRRRAGVFGWTPLVTPGASESCKHPVFPQASAASTWPWHGHGPGTSPGRALLSPAPSPLHAPPNTVATRAPWRAFGTYGGAQSGPATLTRPPDRPPPPLYPREARGWGGWGGFDTRAAGPSSFRPYPPAGVPPAGRPGLPDVK